MRGVAVVLSFLLACSTDEAEPLPDAGVPTACYLTEAPSFCAPVGAACVAAQAELCDFGRGLCVGFVCRAQCSGSFPPCATGLVAKRSGDDVTGRRCWCE